MLMAGPTQGGEVGYDIIVCTHGDETGGVTYTNLFILRPSFKSCIFSSKNTSSVWINCYNKIFLLILLNLSSCGHPPCLRY